MFIDILELKVRHLSRKVGKRDPNRSCTSEHWAVGSFDLLLQ